MSALSTYILAGSLGVLLQILLKIPQLQSRAKAANHSFSLKDYFKNDWAVILASFVSVAIACVCVDELIAIKPVIAEYIKWFFVFVGFTGSTIIQAVLSVTNKKIMAVIDVKTNIADGVTPIVDATNVEGVKEIQKDEEKTKVDLRNFPDTSAVPTKPNEKP